MEVRGERRARTIGYSSVMMERQVGITHGPCQIKKSVDLYNRSGFRDDRGGFFPLQTKGTKNSVDDRNSDAGRGEGSDGTSRSRPTGKLGTVFRLSPDAGRVVQDDRKR